MDRSRSNRVDCDDGVGGMHASDGRDGVVRARKQCGGGGGAATRCRTSHSEASLAVRVILSVAAGVCPFLSSPSHPYLPCHPTHIPLPNSQTVTSGNDRTLRRRAAGARGNHGTATAVCTGIPQRRLSAGRGAPGRRRAGWRRSALRDQGTACDSAVGRLQVRATAPRDEQEGDAEQGIRD